MNEIIIPNKAGWDQKTIDSFMEVEAVQRAEGVLPRSDGRFWAVRLIVPNDRDAALMAEMLAREALDAMGE